MRILLICHQGAPHHPVPTYQFWRSYFWNPLTEEGHDCFEVPNVDWAEGLACEDGEPLLRWRSSAWERTIRFVTAEHKRAPFDLLLAYCYPRQIDGSALQEIRRLGVPCVNFFCDNVREYRRVPHEFRSFDLHWVPELAALKMYRDAGLAYVHAPMPCWVPEELRSAPTRETEPPTFIGSADALRRELLGKVVALGADIAVRGPGWSESEVRALPRERSVRLLVSNQISFVGRHGVTGLLRKVDAALRPLRSAQMPSARIRSAVFGEAYLRVTREATIAIGVNRVPTARASNRRPIVYSRLRDIEAPMAGACYLTEWAPELDGMYDLGREIETYRSADELVGKIDELKRNRDRRRSMRLAAQRRALGEHSVPRSLSRILTCLGVNL